MLLIPLPAFADNYIWLLQQEHRVLAVDPGDGQAVLAWLRAHSNLQLQAILVTHHHADHTGGLADLVQATGTLVYGPALEKLPVPHQPVAGGDVVELCGMDWQVLDVPGHTAGHVAYWAHPVGQAPVLMCGDTLFSGGCGRLFEGTPAQMLASLETLSALPDDTRVCCAHEYTLSNLRFARAVEPDNAALQAYELACIAQRERGAPTLPARLALEREINPFLRSRLASVRQAVQSHAERVMTDDVQVFAQLREWKNTFR